ncbi:MAG: hypothetical protein F2754_10400 [Actinobacteria bacterium]|uniref:Unannotated protein n=1 Tax=freshwater metagenome TaxID=449393 RepID=A0A6J7ANH6_9ZZZZ|nr:hypothetical protein [Actinomycetota bacterium]MSW92836.1 hypothetical protein [Actinomycetota bacterium]MSX87786.1 hypothetical protein [Actinomycetota bacterium]MSY72643.1 hypothetical protein [Actinomycetota bacterium]
MDDRPTFNILGAAHATSASRRTIARMLVDGRIAGASKVEGEWQIPLASLLAAGLKLHAPSPPDAPSSSTTTPPGTTSSAELELLRAENVRLSHRAELAEMETELLRTSLDDLRSVIAKLPPALEAARPKRWFRR